MVQLYIAAGACYSEGAGSSQRVLSRGRAIHQKPGDWCATRKGEVKPSLKRCVMKYGRRGTKPKAQGETIYARLACHAGLNFTLRLFVA